MLSFGFQGVSQESGVGVEGLGLGIEGVGFGGRVAFGFWSVDLASAVGSRLVSGLGLYRSGLRLLKGYGVRVNGFRRGLRYQFRPIGGKG